MYTYTDQAARDFSAYKQELSEMQRKAEQKGLPDDDRARQLANIWTKIEDLSMVKDMWNISREQIDSEQSRLSTLLNGEMLSEAFNSPITWATYQAAESVALERITRANLPRKLESARNGGSVSKAG